jgi:hypothetical protein
MSGCALSWRVINRVRAYLDKGECRMNITTKLFLASIFALSIAAPLRAQSPQEGDYYVPGPTTRIHLTAGQLKKTQEGDYYFGSKTILDHRRMAALKTCTDGIPFDSDHYVECMSQRGEAP